MEKEKLKEHILKYFEKNEQKRQIVFWYDKDKEYQDVIDTLDLPNIKIHKITNSNNLYTKKLLEHDDLTSNYLIYADFDKPQQNWLMDILLYSKELSVDEIENIFREFNTNDTSLKPLIKEYLKFFKSQERLKKFLNIFPSTKTETDFFITMFAVILNIKTPELDDITRKVMIETLLNNKNVLKDFANYNLEDKFWQYIEKRFAYQNEHDTKLLLATIIFKKLKQQMPKSKFPSNYEKYTKDNNCESECNVFINSWHQNKEEYKKLICIIEKDYKIKDNITEWAVEPDFETLKAYDEYLTKDYLINAFDTISDTKLIDGRKDTLFYSEYENIYNALSWAIELNNQKQDIPNQIPDEFVKSYVSQYYKIDKAYRKFYSYYQKSQCKDLDIIREKVENAYVNKYLDNICSKFSNTNLTSWSLSPAQKDFYTREISTQKFKTAVIISDALRYEVAEELNEEICSDYSIKANTELDYMICSIPSYTELGMAALLPHKNIEVSQDGKVLIDGISTIAPNREKILQAENENSKVLNFDDFEKLSREKLKEMVSGVQILYVYHNRIDKTGENDENNVLSECDNAIAELKAKITELFRYNFSNIIITADHGFLYQYNDVEEHQKITIGTVKALKTNKRFILSENPISEQGVKTFDMNYILKDSNLKLSVPQNLNRFKTSGGGIKYVHGGASLQEIVLPVLKVKQNKNLEYQKVDVKLENSGKTITKNTFKLTFRQKEVISENVQPRNLRVYLYDEEEEKTVSEIIELSVNSTDENALSLTKSLILKRGVKNKEYKLILEDVDEKNVEPYNQYLFTVNVMMQADF